MKFITPSQQELNLTYCMNVHPAETWDETRQVLHHSVMAVRKRFDPQKPFGLGLRLSAVAARRLLETAQLDWLRDFLASHNLYVFTINGFPYGPFHGQRVKEQVYEPDWTQSTRRDYTNDLISILAHLLPAGMDGSISTVPVGFGPNIDSAASDQAARYLAECVRQCAMILDQTGSLIHMGLEPEPSCYLENCGDVLRFFETSMMRSGCEELATRAGLSIPAAEEQIRRHLGVCLDTCHAAVQFEDVLSCWERYEQAGMLVSKIQISAALQTLNGVEARRALWSFDEPVYLHQVRARRGRSADIKAWLDLPLALRDLEEYPEDCLVRIHFHVPLFWQGAGSLFSTAETMTSAFWEKVQSASCPHVEVETYTFNVLPTVAAGKLTLEECVYQELQWVQARVAGVA